MTAAAKFHAAVSTATVVIMYEAIVQISPWLEKHPKLGAPTALLSSYGVYRLLRMGLAFLLSKWLWLKKKVFGPEFVEGTWVGHFVGHENQQRLMVEHWSQDFEGLVVSGRSATDALKEHGYWTSDIATVDIRRGRVTFTYTFDVVTRSQPLLGITNLYFERPRSDAAPVRVSGFAHDLNDPVRIALHVKKISDRFVPWNEAFSAARKMMLEEEAQTPVPTLSIATVASKDASSA